MMVMMVVESVVDDEDGDSVHLQRALEDSMLYQSTQLCDCACQWNGLLIKQLCGDSGCGGGFLVYVAFAAGFHSHKL